MIKQHTMIIRKFSCLNICKSPNLISTMTVNAFAYIKELYSNTIEITQQQDAAAEITAILMFYDAMGGCLTQINRDESFKPPLAGTLHATKYLRARTTRDDGKRHENCDICLRVCITIIFVVVFSILSCTRTV